MAVPGRYTSRRRPLPAPLTTAVAQGAWEASQEASHTAASRSPPQQSGTGPASPWPGLASLFRASLLEAELSLGGWRQVHAGSASRPRSEGV